MIEFAPLEEYLTRVPAIVGPVGSNQDRTWWVKFAIDVDHKFSWQVVQEFGHAQLLVIGGTFAHTVCARVTGSILKWWSP
jgi:hypothetical protein